MLKTNRLNLFFKKGIEIRCEGQKDKHLHVAELNTYSYKFCEIIYT